MVITDKEILQIQKVWGDGIVEIGKLYTEGDDYKTFTKDFVENVYNYKYGQVLFKPTKASQNPFRETLEGAMSYFIGGSVAEDHGFALKPYKSVMFAPQFQIFKEGDVAVCMGHYYFIDFQGGETKAEYTFGYTKNNKEHKLVIFLHHSSLPFKK